MTKTILWAGLFWIIGLFARAQPPLPKNYQSPYQANVNRIETRDSELLTQLLNSRPERTKPYLDRKDSYRIQLIWTQIFRDRKNRPIARHHTFRLDTLEYFFPASTIKLPLCALALEKLNRLNIKGLTKYSRIEFDAGKQSSPAETRDPSAASGYPSIAHYIKKILLVSDNPAYDRLYEFLGQQFCNEKLWEKGYTSARVMQRYEWFVDKETNRYTNGLRMYNGDTLLYRQPPLYCPLNVDNPARETKVGRDFMSNGKLWGMPKDYATYNFISLKHLHEITLAICVPGVMPPNRRFLLTADDYKFLHKYMSMYPAESMDPKYDPNFWHAGRWKFFLFGGQETQPPPHIRIFNKVGLSNSFLLDTAYIVDFDARVEFALTGVILCDENGVLNDSFEDYQRIGMQFFQHVGQIIYDHERSVPRRFKPNLEFYRQPYYH